MSDEAALLAAITAHPDEDTPRLVFADWLDERGRGDDAVRAEYIRVECELARLDEDDPDREVMARRKVLGDRSDEIEKRYKRAWGAALVGRKGPLRGRDCFFHFRRGFPGTAYAPADRLIAEGEELFRLAPITEVDANDVTPDNLGALLDCPWLANVRWLTLCGTYEDDPRPDWSALADCSYLRNLKFLSLDRGRLSRAGGARIAAANPFPRLRDFWLSENDSDACIVGLFGGPAFGRLEELYIHECGLGAGAVGVLARCPWLGRVKKLWLPNQPLSPAMIRSMTTGQYWPGLRELSLWGCDLTDACVKALADAPKTRVRRLDLSMNNIGPRGVAALAASPLLKRLEALDLYSNPLLGDAGVRALVDSPFVGSLRRLSLGGCGIGPDGAKAIAECPALSELTELGLYSNAIRGEGALALADSPHLDNLESLSLSDIRGKARTRLKERFGNRVDF